jgi:hypothetical protein
MILGSIYLVKVFYDKFIQVYYLPLLNGDILSEIIELRQ